jgi:magnesium chelatase subunit I
VRTHYPLELDDEIAVVAQEADLVATVPEHLLEVVARFTRHLRESTSIDQRSGVSARFSVAAAETIAAAALRRSAVLGEETAVARAVDLGTIIDVLRGKLEFESGEEGRELEVLEHLLRRSVADTARAHLGGVDLAALVAAIESGTAVVTGDSVTAADLLASLPDTATLEQVYSRLEAEVDGEKAAAAELALEGLYLARRIAKDADDAGNTVYQA